MINDAKISMFIECTKCFTDLFYAFNIFKHITRFSVLFSDNFFGSFKYILLKEIYDFKVFILHDVHFF